MSTATASAGDLLTHTYTDFRGVDFTDKEVSLYRSPDSLNMWKDYSKLGRCIQTRPSIELLQQFDNTVFGLFFYKVGLKNMILVHSGTKLYRILNGETTEIYNNLNPINSQAFIYNNIWYFKDGSHYLQYDGEEIYEVVGYIPTTVISKAPTGEGTLYEDVNMLSDYRKNSFVADGVSTEYKLSEEYIDSDSIPIVWINDVEVHNFTVNYESATITFSTAPDKPLTDGRDNVVIQYKKHISGYADRIKKCNILTVFDNRVFFSGNQDYPNTIWHSSLNDPTYCSDTDYYNEGLDLAKVKDMVAGNNALWVLKEPSQANTTIFYHNPVIDNSFGKTYPSTHSSISTGCISKGINFNDDICFFSNRGMEAITSDITTEQTLTHRSFLIDSKLLNEEDYKDLILAEYEGYLMVFINNHVYLADSNQNYSNYARYEWFYWELPIDVKSATVKDNVLYLGSENGIYTLTGKELDHVIEDNEVKEIEVSSYWCTTYDEFGYQAYQKTTNKRGSVADLKGEEITVLAKIDGKDFEEVRRNVNANGYVVNRIKKKKWKGIQLKFSSNKPFELYSCTLQAYLGAYVKR